MTQDTHTASGTAIDRALDSFERRERGIPQARIAAELVAELRAALASAAAPAQQPGAAYAAAAAILEVIAQEPPINGSHLAQARVLMVAGRLRASHGQAPASKIEGLTAAQESLGVEFEKVLHDNLFDLYEESAPHGQAPAQAEPAAVAVPTFEDFCKRHGLDPKKMDGHGGMWARVALDECRATTQPAPQQEAQEPVAVIGAGFTIFWAGHGPIAPIVERHALKVGSPLYAAPQPSPVAQWDALDAARYHYLRDVPMERWPAELLTAIRLQQNAKWDAAIDAASAAQAAQKGGA